MSLWKPPWIVTPFYIAKVTMPGRSPSLASLVGLRFRDRIANLSNYCCGQLCCGQCKTWTRKVENGFTFHRVQICRYKMAGFVLSLLTFWIVSVLFFCIATYQANKRKVLLFCHATSEEVIFAWSRSFGKIMTGCRW